MDAEAARTERERAMIRGVMQFMALMTFGMPFAVVALYYLAGWKVAVLAFPLLLIGVMRRLMSSPKTDARRTLSLRKAIGLVFLVGVPAAAVAWDEAEIMRIWAYATALPFSLGMALRDKRATNRIAALVAGAVFVAVSDLIWLHGSMAGWIWFHAFAVPIFLAGLVTLGEVLSRGNRTEERRKTRTLAPPPPAEDDMSAPALRCVVLSSDGGKLIYERPSRTQAQAIYDSGWRDDGRLVDEPGQARKKPTLMIAFAANGVLKFEVDGPVTVTVQWTYMELPERGRFLGHPTLVGGRRVPVELGHAVIADAWVDDVEALRDKLRAFDAMQAPGLVTPE